MKIPEKGLIKRRPKYDEVRSKASPKAYDYTYKGRRAFKDCCPCHQDDKPSLSVSEDQRGYALFRCFAGCPWQKISESFGYLPPLPISDTYSYRDADNNELFQVVRYADKSFRFRRKDATDNYIYNLNGIPKVPYKLPQLLQSIHNGETIFIPEGEKDVRTCELLCLSATTSPCGAANGNWNPGFNTYFQGANEIVILSDNDPAGRVHAYEKAISLYPICPNIKVIEFRSLPPKGDITDFFNQHKKSSGSFEQAVSLVREKLFTLISDTPSLSLDDLKSRHQNAISELADSRSINAPSSLNPKVIQSPFENAPFRCLGVQKDRFFYQVNATHEIVDFNLNAHTKNMLWSLAPRAWWYSIDEFRTTNKSGNTNFDLETAISALISYCQSKGIYDSRRIRGRGIHNDRGRIVIHLGNALIVDGVETAIEHFDSNFTYEARTPIDFGALSNPLPVNDSKRLIDILSLLHWKNPIFALYLAGWVVLALLSGIIPWRTHLWLTTPSGFGKTTLLHRIIVAILRDICLFQEGRPSGAGTSQELRGDMIPVIYDEAEASGKYTDRLQEQVELARKSAPDTNAVTPMGTPAGRSLIYKVRSCFLFSSINISLIQVADRTRFAIIEFDKFQSWESDKLSEYEKAISETITPQWISRFKGRVFSMVPQILKNISVFKALIAHLSGNQRSGDLYGGLLAGAWSLLHDTPATSKEAEEWLKDYPDFLCLMKPDDTTPDHMRLLFRILDAHITVSTGHTRVMLPACELVYAISNKSFRDISNPDDTSTQPFNLDHQTADAALKAHGIKVVPEKDSIYIATSHHKIIEFIRDTPWAGSDYQRHLRRIEGAIYHSSERFGPGSQKSAVSIPITVAFQEYEKE